MLAFSCCAHYVPTSLDIVRFASIYFLSTAAATRVSAVVVYSSGIAPQGAYVVTAGPVSIAGPPIMPPAGPGDPVFRLGDDYILAGGDYLDLDVVRIAGAMTLGDDVILEFYDDLGSFVGSFPASATCTPSGILEAQAPPEFIIAPAGYLVLRIAGEISVDGAFSWLSTDEVDVGGNFADLLWVNEGGVPNFMAPAVGILAFELEGIAVPEPIGACCIAADGKCFHTSLWTCRDLAGTFYPGLECGLTVVCSGACCTPAGACLPDTAPGPCAAMAGDFLGFGVRCDPNCCPQPVASGADACADAAVFAIPPLAAGDPPLVITITGDNSTASGTHASPDTCFGVVEDESDDAGWWESFVLGGSCTNVRIGFCCSVPQRTSQYDFLTLDCDCEALVSAVPDPYSDVDAAVGFGGPYCDDSNFWATFGLLGPGFYAYPIASRATGPLGAYQMHVTAQACPEAACCTPLGCVVGVNQLECNALDGYFLAPPNVAPAVVACGPGVCAGPQPSPLAAPMADQSGVIANRFISFTLDSADARQITALRVRLARLHHTCGAAALDPTLPCQGDGDCGAALCEAAFPLCEEEYRYVNLAAPCDECTDSAVFGTSFRCARLGTTPEYRDWAGEFAGKVLRVAGSAIVPADSQYLVSNIPAFCRGYEATCDSASEELMIATARWGDVASGGGGPPDGMVNVIDVGLIVDKVKDIPGALPAWRATLKFSEIAPFLPPVNVQDIGRVVDAVKGIAFPFTPADCEP